MVDKSPTFSTGLQCKHLEQELQEHLARAYYLLVAQEASYADHALLVEGLVSKLKIIAARVEAFHPRDETASSTASISDAKVDLKDPRKSKKSTRIVDDKDESFLCGEHQHYQDCAMEQEANEPHNLKQALHRREDCRFDEGVTWPHVADKSGMSLQDPHIEARMRNASSSACSVARDCARVCNPLLAMRGIRNVLLDGGNDTSTAASRAAPSFNMGKAAQLVEDSPQKKQAPHQQSPTTGFLATIHSLRAEGDRGNEGGEVTAVSMVDYPSGSYSLSGENQPGRLQLSLPELSLSYAANQLEKAVGKIRNSTAVACGASRPQCNQPPGVSCSVFSFGSVAIGSAAAGLPLQTLQKEGLLAPKGDSGTESESNVVSSDKAHSGEAGDPSQQRQQYGRKGKNACGPAGLVSFAPPVVLDQSVLTTVSCQGPIGYSSQGLIDPSRHGSVASFTQGNIAVQPTTKAEENEERDDGCQAASTALGISARGGAVGGLRYAFWPGLLTSHLFLPVEVGVQGLAGMEACFPPYLTQLTAARVRAFHSVLAKGLTALTTLHPTKGEDKEENENEERGKEEVEDEVDWWQRAVDVAAALLTLLPPVLRALQGAASLPLGGPPEASHLWRRYWCRQLYGLLHEAHLGLERVAEFDTRWQRAFCCRMQQQTGPARVQDGNISFSIPTPGPYSDSTVPVASEPEGTCMAAAVQISGFDSESCRVFLHDLAAPGCFPSLLSALTEDGDNGEGWTSGTVDNNSESRELYIEAGVAALEELPPSCPGQPFLAVRGTDPKEQNVVVKVHVPSRVSVEAFQSDLVYFDLLL